MTNYGIELSSTSIELPIMMNFMTTDCLFWAHYLIKYVTKCNALIDLSNKFTKKNENSGLF
jgi:hypothetical protein